MLLLLPTLSFAADYVIGEGDELAISVWGEEALNGQAKVRPDGKITISGIGDVQASGKSPVQLQQELENKLAKLVKYDPIVTVSVTQATNSKVYIFGGGVQHGVFDLHRRTTLLHLLSSLQGQDAGVGAGVGAASGDPEATTALGSMQAADYRKAYVMRDGKKIKENFHPLFIEGNINEDILLQSEDIIFIPPLVNNKIYVVGAVNNPISIPYRKGLTVLEAILEAGGFNQYASKDKTYVIRRDGDRQKRIQVKADDLISGGDLSQNVALEVGDYVIVNEGFF